MDVLVYSAAPPCQGGAICAALAFASSPSFKTNQGQRSIFFLAFRVHCEIRAPARIRQSCPIDLKGEYFYTPPPVSWPLNNTTISGLDAGTHGSLSRGRHDSTSS
jgi:hypothetical protein